jgi:hypothetical protein
MSMPGSVKLSLVALAVVVASLVATGGLLAAYHLGIPLQLPLAALLTIFLGWSVVRKKRLAWLWGRWVGFFLAGAAILGVVMQRRAPTLDLAAALVASVVVPFLVMSVAFGRPSAHRWFGMICPTCGRTARRGDFLMRQLRCPGCGETF